MPQSTKTTGLKKRQAIDKAGKTMLMWVTIASVAVSFLLVAVQFLYNDFIYKNRVLSAKNEASSVLSQNLENVEELKAAFGPLDAGTNPHVNSTKVLNALPRELDTSAFGTSLQKVIAPRSGVTLESVKIEAQDSFEIMDDEDGSVAEFGGPFPQEIDVSMTVAGSYEQLSRFIRDMEITIRPIKINTMNITGSDSSTRATIEMTTYYQPSKEVTIIERELKR